MAKLTFVSSTTTLFVATDTAPATVLPLGTFEQLNEGAAASERQTGEFSWLSCTIFDRR